MTASDREMREPCCDEVIAGEYVLGVLSAEDRRRVEARLAGDRQFAAMVSRWQENLSTFGDEHEATPSPPPGRFAAEPCIPGAVPRDAVLSGKVAGGCWHSLMLWRALALASLAVAAGLAVSMSALLAPHPVPGGRLVATLAGEGTAIGLMAHYDEARGTLRLTPVAEGEEKAALELWLTEEGRAPVSLGVLPKTGEGEVAVPAALRERIAQGATLSLSAEPAAGSPTGGARRRFIAAGAVQFE